MSIGGRLITVARRDVGISEKTGRNDGEPIATWQRLAEIDYAADYGPGELAGAPYCAIGLRHVVRDAQVDIPLGLTHPYTGIICTTADALGGLRPSGSAPPGSFIVRCGVHVGLVVRQRGDLLDTIEYNSGNAVRELVRYAADWRIVVPPGVDGEAPPLIVMRDSWGFDDLTLKPDTWGGWASESSRNAKHRAFARNNPELWTAIVRLDSKTAPYGFRSGRKGTYGATWKLGGWTAERIREERIAAYCKAHGIKGEKGIRRWKTRVPSVHPETGGKATSAGGISTR